MQHEWGEDECIGDIGGKARRKDTTGKKTLVGGYYQNGYLRYRMRWWTGLIWLGIGTGS
jgi:hypothetical protein